jgi:hypothetical protein
MEVGDAVWLRRLDAGVALVLVAMSAALVSPALDPLPAFAVLVAAGTVIGVVAALSVRFGGVLIATALLVAVTALTLVVARTNYDRSHVVHLFPWFVAGAAATAALATILRSLQGWRQPPRRRRIEPWTVPLLLFGVIDGLVMLACRVPPG